MLLTRFFLPVLKENPKEAEIISHIYMLRAGMIQQSASGIYSWLPLGKIVLEKITEICRQEMIKAGANEILMPTLQSAEIWKESGRYEDYGKEMLRIKDRNNRNLLYGPTNEELVTEIFRTHVNSYKELPLNLFHIQWKFRDELRPRFGVMRGREFLMKDAYSFDVDYNCSIKSYNIMFIAYMQLFKKMGLKDQEIIDNFKRPVQMTVFSYGGDIDTTMSPDDSILYYKGYLHAGLISIEPQTGFVKAWVGGVNFKHFSYDHVRLGKRQVGSTIKPFVYCTAINQGVVKPCTKLSGEPKKVEIYDTTGRFTGSCLLYTSPSPRDQRGSRMAGGG